MPVLAGHVGSELADDLHEGVLRRVALADPLDDRDHAIVDGDEAGALEKGEILVILFLLHGLEAVRHDILPGGPVVSDHFLDLSGLLGPKRSVGLVSNDRVQRVRHAEHGTEVDMTAGAVRVLEVALEGRRRVFVEEVGDGGGTGHPGLLASRGRASATEDAFIGQELVHLLGLRVDLGELVGFHLYGRRFNDDDRHLELGKACFVLLEIMDGRLGVGVDVKAGDDLQAAQAVLSVDDEEFLGFIEVDMHDVSINLLLVQLTAEGQHDGRGHHRVVVGQVIGDFVETAIIGLTLIAVFTRHGVGKVDFRDLGQVPDGHGGRVDGVVVLRGLDGLDKHGWSR